MDNICNKTVTLYYIFDILVTAWSVLNDKQKRKGIQSSIYYTSIIELQPSIKTTSKYIIRQTIAKYVLSLVGFSGTIR